MIDWFEAVPAFSTEALLRQSGFSGSPERWEALRRPVADAVDRSGTFLDVGCANGYLLTCLVGWVAERGLALVPYGVDVSEGVVAIARRRSPALSAHFEVGDALTWTTAKRFDFIRTELGYVPEAAQRGYLRRLSGLLMPGGRLLVANYSEGHPDPASTALPGGYATADLAASLAVLGLGVERFHDGLDPIKGRRTRVAVLSAGS